jgi:cell division inhibitor SulA
LTPALHAVAAEGRGIALLAPPFLPQARAWQGCGIALERLLIIEADGSELLWAAEQVLRSGECGAVLLWSQAAGRALNHRALQRLHLAASTGNAACFLYRAPSAQHHPSPAPLRLRLAAHQDVLHLDLVKSRGALHARTIVIQPFPAHWQATFTAAPASPARAASASPMSVRKKAVAVIQAHLLASAQVSLRASAQTSAQTKARSQGSSGAKPVSMDGEMLPRSSAAAIASLHDPLPFPTHIIEA